MSKYKIITPEEGMNWASKENTICAIDGNDEIVGVACLYKHNPKFDTGYPYNLFLGISLEDKVVPENIKDILIEAAKKRTLEIKVHEKLY